MAPLRRRMASPLSRFGPWRPNEPRPPGSTTYGRFASIANQPSPERPRRGPLPASRPVRRLLETGEVREPPLMLSLAASDPHVKEQAAKVTKIQALFDLLIRDFPDLTELGVSRDQLQDATRMQLLKEAVMPAADRLSVNRLGALLSTLRRWREFALRLGFELAQPSPLQLNTFFKEVARGGPTAGSSVFHALNWFRAQFGLQFPLDHWLVRGYKLLPVGHTSQQKLELQPWEFMNLLLKLRQSSGTKSLDCIRFEHVQRSNFDRTEANAMFFTCSQGKARRQGARPAFQWAMPDIPFPGFSLVKIIHDFVTQKLLLGRNYLWPALQLDPLDLWQVTEHTPWRLDRKLSRGRFLELLRGTLLDLGTAPDQAQTAGFNRLRRFMRLYHAKKAELALTDEGLHPRDSWTCRMRHSRMAHYE